MPDTEATLQDVREHARLLLRTIGVSRIVVVDDEYAPEVEELLGICAVLSTEQATNLPHLSGINF